MKIESLDHLVLTVTNLEATCLFYEQAMGMTRVAFGEGRLALAFGNQKLNLHLAGKEHEPKAAHPTPGSVDLCFLTTIPLEEVISHMASLGIPIELGPVERTGAQGPLQSIYLRDPDRNLVEISNQIG